MKQPHYVFRAAAVVSSVLLVGAFVGCRAGAFNWLSRNSEGTANSESKPISEEKLFHGTKSGVISSPDLVSGDTPAQPAPTIMGGTKDFSPMKFIEGITPGDTFTSDLDIPLKKSAFTPAIRVPISPPDAKPPANPPPSKPGQ